MRITELYLENFAPILAGTGKEKIHINLRDSKELINVFIGKIGSGKTYILSHLQPFSTVGTLDVRNSDDPIISGKDGKKIIIYEKDGHEYVITHIYTASGTSHTKKSYITKDDIELNPNGNSSTFKDVILEEFGIDQSFLRLVRLGPNVINFINMKATERKSYIASLLSSTEVYLMLHKYWSQELRTINTTVNVLMNKLNSYGKKSLEELLDDFEDLEDRYKDKKAELDNFVKSKYELSGEISSKMNGLSYSDFLKKKSNLESELSFKIKDKDNLEDLMKSYSGYSDITEISKLIGKYDSELSTAESKLSAFETEYEDISTKLNILRDKKAISFDASHMDTLRETYESLMEQKMKYEVSLNNFKCDYSSQFLTGFVEDLNLMNVLIQELSQYNQEVVKRLFHSDSSCIEFSRKKLEILNATKLNRQKMINNLKFSESYEASRVLYFPPMCPTKTCPYYQTHPETIQRSMKNKDGFQNELTILQNEIQQLDIEIYLYSDYPIIYSKISQLRGYWNKAKPILESIKSLNCDDLYQIVTNPSYQVWYNYDRIINTIDLLSKRDDYSQLTEKIKLIKTELTSLELDQDESIDKEISSLSELADKIMNDIHIEEKNKKEASDNLKSYNDLYVILSEKSIHEEQLTRLTNEISDIKKELSEIQNSEEIINTNRVQISHIDQNILLLESSIGKITEEMDALKTKMNDMKYTNSELERVLQEQKYMSLMVDSVSSKKGIPLEMVILFLDSCRDTLNEMLYAVCEDDIEILKFDINETEFKIPYMVNGQVIDDISKASQGQSSIVSTTMSFALVKQTGSFMYNIPLLDEMDAPLHKNDKQKFIAILLQYLEEIGSEQCFVITHDDNTFVGHKVQVIMTTDELVDQEKYKDVIHI